ncbi:hypothetical protein Dimus_029464, partial [Dionaea muscipula]
ESLFILHVENVHLYAHALNSCEGKIFLGKLSKSTLTSTIYPLICSTYILLTGKLHSSGPWAATGSIDRTLVVWDLQHSAIRSTCEHEDGVTCLSWLGTSRYLATGCVDGKVRLWDSLSGICVKTFHGHSEAIQSLVVSSNGNFLISVSLDGTARVFEIDDFK